MNFLDQVYFDNTVRSYALVCITILAAFFLKRIISKYASALLLSSLKKNPGRLAKIKFDDIVIEPLEKILFILISIFSIDSLNFPSAFMFTYHKVSSQHIFEGLISAIIIICFVILIIRVMDFFVLIIKEKAGETDTPGEHQLLFFFKDLIRVIIIIIGILFIIKFSLKFNIGNLFTGLSIVGAALALSARESLENLIASFIIFFDKPFKTGDSVKVNTFSGIVERIGLRSTRLRTPEKSMVTVPNKQMVDSIVDNWTMRDVIRNEIKTLLSPHTTSGDLQKAIKEIEQILANKKEKVDSYSVYLQEINNDSAVVIVIYFTKFPTAIDGLNKLKEEINLEIKKMQEQHEIKQSSTSTVKLVS